VEESGKGGFYQGGEKSLSFIVRRGYKKEKESSSNKGRGDESLLPPRKGKAFQASGKKKKSTFSKEWGGGVWLLMRRGKILSYPWRGPLAGPGVPFLRRGGGDHLIHRRRGLPGEEGRLLGKKGLFSRGEKKRKPHFPA